MDVYILCIEICKIQGLMREIDAAAAPPAVFGIIISPKPRVLQKGFLYRFF